MGGGTHDTLPTSMSDVTRILSADRAGRPQGRRAAAAAGLRRAAEAGRPETGPGEAGADAPGHGPGPRGVHPAGGCREGPALGQPGPFLRRRGRGHAADSGRERPPQAQPKARRRARQRWISTGRRSPLADDQPMNCSPWTRPSTSSAQAITQAAELVKLRYFAGLTIEEAAEALGISARTADADWAYARAWLRRELVADGRTRRRSEHFREISRIFVARFRADSRIAL